MGVLMRLMVSSRAQLKQERTKSVRSDENVDKLSNRISRQIGET